MGEIKFIPPPQYQNRQLLYFLPWRYVFVLLFDFYYTGVRQFLWELPVQASEKSLNFKIFKSVPT